MGRTATLQLAPGDRIPELNSEDERIVISLMRSAER